MRQGGKKENYYKLVAKKHHFLILPEIGRKNLSGADPFFDSLIFLLCWD